MTKSIADGQRGRALQSLLLKGLVATAIGVTFVLAPQWLASHLRPLGPIESLTSGIRFFGLILLAIGVGALAVRHSVSNRTEKLSVLRRTGGVGDRISYSSRGASQDYRQGFPVRSDSTEKAPQTDHLPTA